jgi:hypothetical protein
LRKRSTLEITGPPLKALHLKMPESVKQLGYPPARLGANEGCQWFEQEGVAGFAYAIYAGWKRVGQTTLLPVTVTTREEPNQGGFCLR